MKYEERLPSVKYINDFNNFLAILTKFITRPLCAEVNGRYRKLIPQCLPMDYNSNVSIWTQAFPEGTRVTMQSVVTECLVWNGAQSFALGYLVVVDKFFGSDEPCCAAGVLFVRANAFESVLSAARHSDHWPLVSFDFKSPQPKPIRFFDIQRIWDAPDYSFAREFPKP